MRRLTHLFRWAAFIVMSLTFTTNVASQNVALKTNALGWLTTTLNAGIEGRLSKDATLQVFGALNPWTFSGEKRVRFWSVQPEVRHWFCESFNGHFVGVHLLGGEYNVRNVTLPFGILPKTDKGNHYEGWYAGAGITYGYQWLLSRHWNLEAEIGVGYAYSRYKRYGTCDRCLDRDHRNYVGPTKLGISIMYLF